MDRSIPRGIGQRAGRGTTVRHVLLTCGLLLAAPVGLFSQGGDNVRSFWVPTRNFYIPFSIDNDPRIVEVRLYAATDGRDYIYTARAKPAERRFTFQAKQDGTYSFIVQSVNQDGSLSPADLRNATPNIRIYVDTQKPIVGLYPEKKEGFAAAIKWDIQDDNFDDVRAYYRSAKGGEWYPVLDLPRLRQGSHGWRPAVGGALEVQLQARDKAGNVGEKNATIEPDARGANMAPQGGGDSSDVKHVKGRKFQLDFQVDKDSLGPSGVKTVDIWKMRDGGPWQKCREVGDPEKPVMVTVDAAGRWGFRLIPRSGVGLAEPDPRPGEAPDLWVEVDEQLPRVEINRLLVGQGPDAGNLTVYWTASDKFLRARPISIFYRVNESDPWKDVARDLPNSGSYSFKPLDLDRSLYQFSVRVTAIDEAGNEGEAISKEPVKVDLKIPRIRKEIQVRPSEAAAETRGLPPPPTMTPAGRKPDVKIPLPTDTPSKPPSFDRPLGRD